jgi:hypothetical protein
MNPADATTYYIGGSKGSITATANQTRILIPISGVIRSVSVQIFSVTATGTNEDWTVELFDGTTAATIATLGAATIQRNWVNNNMNYPVVSGGYVTIRTTSPTWVTNPEGCTAQYHIVVEYE